MKQLILTVEQTELLLKIIDHAVHTLDVNTLDMDGQSAMIRLSNIKSQLENNEK